MKHKILIYIILQIILLSCYALGQERLSSTSISKIGTTIAQFLKIGVSARSIGMGDAFVAVANDVSAISINPAGLARMPGYEVLFTHTNWLADTKYDFGALSLNLYNVGTLAFMVSAFSSGDMLVRTIEQPDGTGERFSTQDFLIGVAYSRNLTNNFSIGITGKYISQRLWHMQASTIAVDVGLLYSTPFWGINLGASISNFGSNMSLEGRDTKFAQDPDPQNLGNVKIVNAEYEMLSYPLPLTFRVGLAKDLVSTENHIITVAIDALSPNDNYEALNAGMEYGWSETLFLRAGYKSLLRDDSEEGLTAGFGLNLRLFQTTWIKLDYAYADFGRLERTDRFSLSIQF